MTFDILTLFPAMFAGPLSESIIRRASDNGLLDIRLHQIRDYAAGRHRVTDDYPYGGGAGMVMKVEPIAACLESVRRDRPSARVILMSPQGQTLNQALLKRFSCEPGLILICGHYEGVDERVRDLFVNEEVSLGDFVLTGGELAAMVLVDGVSRLIPGVLGSAESSEYDSFSDGLLEYPHYTRPSEFSGHKVPEVLLGGNHQEIARWRREQSLHRTLRLRPELLKTAQLGEADMRYLRKLEKTDC